jgi:hypothetical protein
VTVYLDLDDLILVAARAVDGREATALLAVIAELLVDDPAPQLRCRHELAERGEHLLGWITALPRVDVYRAVRRTHVVGDVDELVIGMRLDSGHELTIAVQIDHNMLSSVADAGVAREDLRDPCAGGRIQQRHRCFRDEASRCAGVDRGCAQQADSSRLRPIPGRSTGHWFSGW